MSIRGRGRGRRRGRGRAKCVRCTASKREIGVEDRYDRYDVSEGATLLWSVKHALTPRLPTPFGGRARG